MKVRIDKNKRVTVSKLKKDVWDIFSVFVRLRDCLLTTGSIEYGECITCDGHFTFSQLQAGHFVPKHNGNYFSERGVHAQCWACNCMKHGQQLEYRRQIVKLYGEGVDEELEEEAGQIKKFTIQGLEELMAYYKEQIKILKEG